MLLSDFDYSLPDELIARYPSPERRASRLLCVSDELVDTHFSQLPDYIESGDLLIFNDTRVLNARLHGRKESGGRIEVLVERCLTETEALAQVRASKSPRPGGVLHFPGDCIIEVIGREDSLYVLRFSTPIAQYLEEFGEVPLPPYIDRAMDDEDRERYQTVYASKPGAVAAPTAGLHFDKEMLAETRALGAKHAFVTLHVGAGTFQPLRSNRVADNKLHTERIEISENVARQVRETRAAGGRVIAVGTTSLRALESASSSGEICAFNGETDIFIVPGYRFRSVDLLLTNFHLPKSSLMLLVSAFAGREQILHAYQHAVANRYRFFSYGDAMLLKRAV